MLIDRPNVILTEQDNIECIMCDCIYDKICYMIELSECNIYNGTWYCIDCPYLEKLKTGEIIEKVEEEEDSGNVYDPFKFDDLEDT